MPEELKLSGLVLYFLSCLSFFGPAFIFPFFLSIPFVEKMRKRNVHSWTLMHTAFIFAVLATMLKTVLPA